MTEIACVQNQFNLAHRNDDDLIEDLAGAGIAYVPFFPFGGFSPLQSSVMSEAAAAAWSDAHADRTGLAASDNILLIPGTSSRAHLRDNLAAAHVDLDIAVLARLELIAGPTQGDPAPL